MFGIIPISFRFRGKLKRLARIYQCFIDHPGTGLHPTQIARYTGIGFQEVNNRLEAKPELFVNLSKPDGITRYRLTTATTARSREEVEQFLISAGRRVSLVLYAFTAMLICILLIMVILIAPAL